MKPLQRLLSIILPLVFVAAGIFMIFISASKLIKLHNNAYTPVTAVIDHINVIPAAEPNESDTRNVYVRYTVDGQEYVELLDETTDTMVTGQELEILYETENPKKVTLPGATSSYFIIAFGAVAILVGIIAFIRGLAGK